MLHDADRLNDGFNTRESDQTKATQRFLRTLLGTSTADGPDQVNPAIVDAFVAEPKSMSISCAALRILVTKCGVGTSHVRLRASAGVGNGDGSPPGSSTSSIRSGNPFGQGPPGGGGPPRRGGGGPPGGGGGGPPEPPGGDNGGGTDDDRSVRSVKSDDPLNQQEPMDFLQQYVDPASPAPEDQYDFDAEFGTTTVDVCKDGKDILLSDNCMTSVHLREALADIANRYRNEKNDMANQHKMSKTLTVEELMKLVFGSLDD